MKTIGVTNKKDNEIVYHLHSLGRLLCSRITPSECAMCRYAEHGVIMTRIRPHPGLEIQIINRSFPNANHAHAELREFLIEVIHMYSYRGSSCWKHCACDSTLSGVLFSSVSADVYWDVKKEAY